MKNSKNGVNCGEYWMNNPGSLGSQYCEHLLDPLEYYSVDTKEYMDNQSHDKHIAVQDEIHKFHHPELDSDILESLGMHNCVLSHHFRQGRLHMCR